MAFDTIYRPLFHVNIFHNYFLNEGANEFTTMTSTEQNTQLRSYDIDDFVVVQPTTDTLMKLAGHKMVFKSRSDGFSVYSKVSPENEQVPFIAPEDGLQLNFLLKVTDKNFENYTDLSTSPLQTFYFGNLQPNTEGIDFETIHLASEPEFVSDSFKISEEGTLDVHKKLFPAEKINLFGIIQLSIIGDDDSVSILNADGTIKNIGSIPAPEPQTYKLHFNNRSTFWRYINSNDNSEVFTTPGVQPLTKNGFVQVEFDGDIYPNPTPNIIIQEINNYISETYI